MLEPDDFLKAGKDPPADDPTLAPSVGLSKSVFKFPVIGVGASAGGLESLEQLFEGIAGDCNAAFVVVQHLSPDFKSMMDEILSRRTKLRVLRIEDNMSIEPGTVYLIPPNADLELRDEKLILLEREFNQGVSQPIDRFFASLAKARGVACAAVVCSGSGSDGSRGIRSICEAGGMVLVEDPETARFDGMPRAAMDTGLADFGGSIHQISVWIRRFVKAFSDPQGIFKGSTPPNTGDDDYPPVEGIQKVIQLLKAEYKIDFAQYKPNMIERRIERRWHLLQFASIEQYIALLQTDPGELNKLYQDLLIGVTRFFRDPDAFAELAELVLPNLVKERKDRLLRVWTPGCATGEETYSLAIEIFEAMEATHSFCDVKIFATDAHRLSLEKAASGIYSPNELANVSPERMTRHFQPNGSGFQVQPAIRKMIVFAPQNLLHDASFTNIDLIVCRNLLIYFGDAGQRRALALMHFGLRKDGYLFLGPSETLGMVQNDYETISRRWRIYKKTGSTKSGISDLRAASRSTQTLHDPMLRSTPASNLSDRMILTAIEGLAIQFLPPTFVTNAEFTLLYSTPGAAEYLRRQEGRYGSTLPELLVPALKTSVLIALQRCARQAELDQPVIVAQVAVPLEQIEHDRATNHQRENAPSDIAEPVVAQNGYRQVSIFIRRVNLTLDNEFGFSVTIAPEQPARLFGQCEATDSLATIDLSAQATLEEELHHTRESLQSTIQELETSNEELQAANEEMVAANEELQSTNEELHSVNEELYTVNSEHQKKIEQLYEITEDMENLFHATNAATLFLDEDARIRRMTPKAAAIFGLSLDDVGRNLENFRNPLQYAALYDDIRGTSPDSGPKEREVTTDSGERFLLQLMPYVSSQSISGTVLTLVSLKHLEASRLELLTREARFRGTFENAAVGIAHVGTDGSWLRVNERLCEMVGYSLEELIAMDFQSITHPDDLNADLDLFEQLKAGEIERYSIRKRYIHKQGAEVPIDLTVSLQREHDSAEPYCISIVQDASERVKYQRQLELSIAQRDQFLAVLSHELRNPLGAVRNAIRLLRRTNNDPDNQSELMELLFRQTDHMSRLVEDLLDTSRITQNKIAIQRELMDLSDIAEESVRSLRSSFEEKQQTLTLELHGESFPVIGDRTRLLQVVENLLANSRRYTQVHGMITVSLKVDMGFVCLSVRDNGQGIDAQHMESIFCMFARGRETEETQGGLGVGLALAKMLIENHDGHLVAASDGVGKGAEFTIKLPMATIPSGMTMPDAHSPQPQSPATIKSRRIVLVEDDADVRTTLANLLCLDGHHVLTASDGADGLQKIISEKPEIALVDLSMPGLSGIELASRLANEPGANLVRLIALTGHGQPQDLQRTKNAGFAGHLIKPIDIDRLNQLMCELIE